jgi:hypothetical protein
MLIIVALGLLALVGLLVAIAVSNAKQEVTMHRQIKYRTRDGRADYSFEFAQLGDGTWRPYILGGPAYGTRDTSLHATHRLRDGGGRYYICWTHALRSEQEARQVAALWADKTQEYIRTGRRF